MKETPGPFFSQTEEFIASLRSENVQEDITVSVNDAQRASFDSSVRKAYFQALLDCLLQRFPEMPLLSALQIFDPRNLPAREQIAAYGNDSLEVLLQRLPGFVDPDEALTEWLSLKTAMQNHPTLKNAASVPALVQELSKNHSEENLVLRKLADWGLAISLSTADAERDFSLLKLVKSARRSRVSNVTLQHIMAVKIDAPPMEEFPFEEALTY